MNIQNILNDVKSKRSKKVILDTDAYNEIDDQYAIAYCYLSESIDLLSVNAAHFAHNPDDSREACMLQSYEEIKKVLALCDPDYKTPVFKGCADTMDRTGTYIDSESVENIINTARAADEIIYILTIGAGTNVASAIMKAPDIKEKICVVWLALAQLHLPDPVEYNLDQDYKAGQYLLDCGVPCIIVPACWVTSVLRSDIYNTRDLRGHNAVCDYLCDITEERYNMVGGPDVWARTIWDLGAPAVIDMPQWCDFKIVKAPILTEDRKFAFDDSRHDMIFVDGLERDPIFKQVWDLLKK